MEAIKGPTVCNPSHVYTLYRWVTNTSLKKKKDKTASHRLHKSVEIYWMTTIPSNNIPSFGGGEHNTVKPDDCEGHRIHRFISFLHSSNQSGNLYD